MALLNRLLRPNSIAVFGGSWAEGVVEQCRRFGFAGDIWPVHRTRAEIGGIRCFRSVDQLPSPPDACFVGVNRESTVQIVRELSGAGAGGAVCFASGFAEVDEDGGKGRRLQAELIEAASDMPILGPNCYGFVNYLDGSLIWPDQHGGVRCGTGVGIVMQSSNIAINVTMQRRGLPVGCIVAAGNQAQTSQARIAAELLEDSRITAIGLYIEGFGDVGEYVRLAQRARDLNKPIVAVKSGRTEKSRLASVSHTAAIVGSDKGADAVFDRLGIARVDGIQQFLETLKLFHGGGPLRGRSLGSLSCSGGEAALVADAAAKRRVRFDDLCGEQAAALGRALGPLVHISNPLDYHMWHWGDEEALTEVFGAMMSGPQDLVLLVMDFPRSDRCSDTAWEPAAAAIVKAAELTGGRAAVVSSLTEGLPESWAERLFAAGITPLQGIDEALAAAEAAADVGECWINPIRPPVAGSRRPATVGVLMNEAESKRLLEEAGVPVPPGRGVPGREEVVRAAREVGFPVVLKRLGVSHKTGTGAIKLGLTDCRQVQDAALRMDPSGGYLVERQIDGAVAELIIGVIRDPECGLLLTVGAGGVWTELIDDVQCLLLPATSAEIGDALRRLRIWPILEGYRGNSGADINAAGKAIESVVGFAQREAGRLLELEVNPLLALPKGAVAADALIRIANEET